MNKRFLLPAFLLKVDNYLLRNKPEIWSARIHLVAWYSLLFTIALGALCNINYTDARLSSNVGYWVGFVSVIAILAVVVWVIYLLRFNVFKRFGLTNAKSRLLTFLLYFIACGLITFYAYVPLIVETWRAKQQFSINEVLTDINKINLYITEQEMSQLPLFWQRDTLHVVDKVPDGSPQFYDRDDYYLNNNHDKISSNYFVTKSDLQYYLSRDSILQITNSTYVHFSPPNLEFLNFNYPYYDIDIAPKDEFTSIEIYRKARQNMLARNNTATANELTTLLNKYYKEENKFNYIHAEDNQTILGQIEKKYNLQIIQAGINHVSEKLNRFNNSNNDVLFRFWFYISFVVALLLFIYRHSTTKTFFLSLLTAIILFILSTLVSAFAKMYDTDFFLWFFGYFILFTILSIQNFYSNTRSVIKGIAINLWVALLPFIPLLIVTYIYAVKQSRDVVKKIITTDYAEMHRNVLISEFAGPIIFCVLIIVFLHRLYTQWFSLPEE
jgi:hypothetical protein